MELVLKVPYKGKPMMVGKVFSWQGETIFYHEHSSTQYFHSIPSLPVDWVVLNFLEKEAINRVDYYDRDKQIFRTTTVTIFREKGIRLQLDTRDRVFLPLSEWREIPATYKTPFILLEAILGD